MTDKELQRRYEEFLELLPLTICLAGLPPHEHGRYYTEEQIEARSLTIKHAFKVARQAVQEAITLD